MQVRSLDGTTLNIRRFGQSPPGTLLLHGFGDGGFVWGPIVRLLQSSGSFLAPDLRGHGDSAWDPQRRYTPEVYAADIEHILQSLELRDLVVIGHSLGASIAIHLAAQHPDRVRHLVIVDGGPDLRKEGLDFLFEQFRQQPWHYDSTEHYATALSQRLPLAARPVLQEFAGHALRPVSPRGVMLKCDPALREDRGAVVSPSVSALFDTVHCPVLLIRGSVSGILSNAAATNLARRAANCQLRSIARAGHALLLDNPTELAATLQSVIR
jgi:pimeloyl-ACP methyl ester carboxylesterase